MINTVTELNELIGSYKDHIPRVDEIWKKVRSISVKEVDKPIAQRAEIVYGIIENLLVNVLEDIKINGPQDTSTSQLDTLLFTLAIIYLKVLNNNDLLNVIDNGQLDLPFSEDEI